MKKHISELKSVFDEKIIRLIMVYSEYQSVEYFDKTLENIVGVNNLSVVRKIYSPNLNKGNSTILDDLNLDDNVCIIFPENGYHPINQRKIIDSILLYSKLNSHKIIIVVSNSSDIFNIISNRILQKKLDHSKTLHIKIIQNGNNEYEEMYVDELGVDDDIFLPFNKAIYNEKISAVESLNDSVF